MSERELPVFTVDDLEAVAPFDVHSFTKEDAVDLGTLAVALIRERALDLAVDVVLRDDLVFRAKLGATGPDNDFWLAGKAAVARHFGVPSLLVRRRYEAEGRRFEDDTDPAFDHSVMRSHGGAIPILVAGEVVGTVTASGEPDVIDHQTACDAVALYLARRP
ncbi:heme-degrading domain-containing protein [Cnuibacter sp. UC19_7]|uniref:heme-degrading domain-containing protein n=1 Tax=Cnuibacter sp. UC19_7 TaxID=3350166 RepID=UPI00366CD3E8